MHYFEILSTDVHEEPKMFEFTTQGTCSKKIFVELDGKKIKSVAFEGGCNGNLKAIGKLVKDHDIDEIIPILRGNR